MMIVWARRTKGGEGSGYFNHPGRPNKVGGSLPKGAYHPAHYQSFQDLPDYEDLVNTTGNFGSYMNDEDKILHMIMMDQGFDGPPEVCTKEELDQHIKDGETELWRGIADFQNRGYAEQFRSGEVYAGQGTYGNGIYSSSKRSTADGFAGSQGKVLRMTIKKGSKVIRTVEANSIISQEQKAALQKLDSTDLSKMPDTEFQRLTAIMDGSAQDYRDPGRWAASRGYDAMVRTLKPSGEQYYIILNRTAVRVEENDYEGVG